MKRFSMAVGACLVAGFCQVCVAQTEQMRVAQAAQVPASRDPKKPPPPEITKDRLAQIEKDYSRVRSLLYTNPIDCTGSNECRVTIYMYQWSDPNGVHCVGLLPKSVKFPGTAPGNNAKRIVWELQPLSPMIPANSRFEFLGDGNQGVLVFKNIVGNSAAGGRQLKEGKVGAAPGNSSSRDKFHMKNEHKWKGEGPTAAAYLPIVVHKTPDSAVPSQLPDGVEVGLCGIPDPLIENIT